jgi:hypothetical protein
MSENQKPSDRKRAAASANGKLARGCKTPEGKAQSAMNSVTHGSTAEMIILNGQDSAMFDRLLCAYAERFQPANEVEMDMLADIVIAKSRHRRVGGFESSAIEAEVENQRPLVDSKFESPSDQLRSALAYHDMEKRTRVISAMNSHQGRLYREYRQAIRLLVEFQRDRLLNAKLQNEANPISEQPENVAELIPVLPADRGGNLLEFPRPILPARPEESLEPVAFRRGTM